MSTVSIEADTEPFLTALDNLQALSARFGAQLTGALRSAVVDGKELDTVLRRLALNLAGTALSQGLQPLQDLVGFAVVECRGWAGRSAALRQGRVVPFASGGVVSAPTYFPAGGSLGLMGEAGAEAILPLRRGADGRLGVSAGGVGQPVNIVFNVTTPDAGSFRKSKLNHRNAGKGGIARDADTSDLLRNTSCAYGHLTAANAVASRHSIYNPRSPLPSDDFMDMTDFPAFMTCGFPSPFPSARPAGRSGATRS